MLNVKSVQSLSDIKQNSCKIASGVLKQANKTSALKRGLLCRMPLMEIKPTRSQDANICLDEFIQHQ